MKIEQLQVGDKLNFWHDTGCMGADLIFCEIIKLGKKKIKVRDEFGNEGWRYPHFFNRKVKEEVWNNIGESHA